MSHLNIFINQSIKSSSSLNFQSQFVNDDIVSVSNFLNFQKNSQNHYTSEDKIRNLGDNSSILNQSQIPIEMKKEVKPQKKASKTHNFQKNLVQTLQKLETPLLLIQMPQRFPIEEKLWKKFQKSSMRSKRLIHLTFFGINSLVPFNGKGLRKYALEKLSKQYPIEVILAAQRNLREMVIQQLQKLNLEVQISKRRIQKKKEFKDYFQRFMEEMRTGEIIKRRNLPQEESFDCDSILDSQINSDDFEEEQEYNF